jgi:hypothetical protein
VVLVLDVLEILGVLGNVLVLDVLGSGMVDALSGIYVCIVALNSTGIYNTCLDWLGLDMRIYHMANLDHELWGKSHETDGV